MRYWRFAAERCVAGTVVQRTLIAAPNTAAAIAITKDITRALSGGIARNSIVRLVGLPLGEGYPHSVELPIIAFRRGAKANRVHKV